MLIKKTISYDPDSLKTIPLWIEALGSRNSTNRIKAREELIKAGSKAVPALIKALTNQDRHVRLEAARVLTVSRNSSAAPALVKVLEDDETEVRWAAMEALIALSRDGLEPLLIALTENFDSIWLREGAHHILSELKKEDVLRLPTLNVIRALEGLEPEITVPAAAESARERLFGIGRKK